MTKNKYLRIGLSVMLHATSLMLAFFVIFFSKTADAATLNVPASYGSIQAAVNAAVSGDTISVGAGTYNEKVTVNKSGITLISSPARAATIDGSGKVSAWDGVVTVNGYSNIKISGFKIINSGYGGVVIYGDSGPASNITVENNYFNNILSSAIVAARCGPGIIFDGNEITGSHTAPMGSENEIVDMITVDGFEIKNNYIHGNYNVESIDIKSGSRNGSIHHNDIIPVASAGIYLDARQASEPALENINIYNNKVHDGPGYGIRGIPIASEEGGAVYHIKIYNNIVYNLGAGGIVLASYNGDSCFGGPCWSGPTDDIQIVNNTVYNNDHTSGWNQGGISYDTRPSFAPTNVVMRNNISWNNNGPQVRSPSGAIADHNFVVDPSVVNAAGGDFHLTLGSPAKGAGLFTALLSGTDYDGSGWLNPPSEGAFEFGGTPPPAHCTNSVQDADEIGIDCGGADCPACPSPPPPPPCTPNGCGGGCPAGCTGADDPDCVGQCLDNACATDTDCAPPPPPPPCTDTCASLGFNCGNQTVCGSTVNCGACSYPYVCNATGQCACTPTKTCADYPDQCNPKFFDGCSAALDCSGACAAPKACNTMNWKCEIPLSPPTTAPTLTADPATKAVLLSWTIPSGLIGGYKVYRDGVLIATVKTLSFRDVPGDYSPHSYQVSAFNAAGEGPKSAAVSEAASPPAAAAIDRKTGVSDFRQLIANVFKWALSAIGSLALLMIIIGGLMYMSSTGSEQRVANARKTITFAILGLVLVLAAYIIASIIERVFG